MKAYERSEAEMKAAEKKEKIKQNHLRHPIRENDDCFGNKDERVFHSLSDQNRQLAKLSEIQTSTGDIIVSKDMEDEAVLIEFTQKTNQENTANDYEDDHFALDHSTTVKSDVMHLWVQSVEKNMMMLEGQEDHKYQHYKKALDQLQERALDTGSIDAAAPTMQSQEYSDVETARDLAIENKINQAIEKGKHLTKKAKNQDFPELIKKRLLEMQEELLEEKDEEEA